MNPHKRKFPTLKIWRHAHGWSTREAALVLGVSQSTYSRLERGVHAVKGPQAKFIRERTGVPLEVLVGAA